MNAKPQELFRTYAKVTCSRSADICRQLITEFASASTFSRVHAFHGCRGPQEGCADEANVPNTLHRARTVRLREHTQYEGTDHADWCCRLSHVRTAKLQSSANAKHRLGDCCRLIAG